MKRAQELFSHKSMIKSEFYTKPLKINNFNRMKPTCLK